MKKFLMALFASHDWIVDADMRLCRVCGRRDIEQSEQGDFSESLEWHCVDAGDVQKHWPRLLPLST